MPGPPETLPETLAPTPRSTLHRKRDRGHHEWEAVAAILDEGLLCHIGFPGDRGTFVVPMAYARVDRDLYLHGAAANRTLRALADGAEACVTVTLLDGLVLARSAFHHSMNYRSAMLFGAAVRVTDPEEQLRASAALLDHMAPGRSREARAPTPKELRATLIVRFPVDEGSAKIRTGSPVEEPEDLDLPIWAGVIPLHLAAGAPVADAGLAAGLAPPSYLAEIARP